MDQKFPRSIDTIDEVFSFITRFAERYKLKPDVLQAINLAVEEIFTNMVKYNRDREEPIELGLHYSETAVTVTLTDIEDKPFDVTKSKVYDLNQSLEQRPVGRLGLYLVNKMMDKIDFRHDNKKTTITMVKFLGDQDV